jgi:hypothetical protein
MSDAPLFQDADEEEARYSSSGAEVEEETGEQEVDLPVVGLAPSGMATPTSPAGPPGVVPPAATDLPEDEEEDDSERLPRT